MVAGSSGFGGIRGGLSGPGGNGLSGFNGLGGNGRNWNVVARLTLLSSNDFTFFSSGGKSGIGGRRGREWEFG